VPVGPHPDNARLAIDRLGKTDLNIQYVLRTYKYFRGKAGPANAIGACDNVSQATAGAAAYNAAPSQTDPRSGA
jgi:hypothetical protein